MRKDDDTKKNTETQRRTLTDVPDGRLLAWSVLTQSHFLSLSLSTEKLRHILE